MSQRTDAEAIRDLANRIVQIEIVKDQFVRSGGVIFAFDNPDVAITPTNAQKQAALAGEAALWTQLKALAAPY